jgi:hypothetical protein
MRGKIIFVVGLATGYVLGTRAGRERYEQIKAGAEKVWSSPVVQSGVHTVQDYAGARVDAVKADLAQKARSALAALIGREPLSGPQQSAAAAKAGSTRATPATSRAAGSSSKQAGSAKPASKTTATKKPTGAAASTTAKSAETAAADSDD